MKTIATIDHPQSKSTPASLGEPGALAKAIEPVFPLKRKKYTPEFRQEVVRRMLAGESGEQMARDYGISPSMAHSWRNKFMLNGADSAPTSLAEATPENVVSLMQAENARLRLELERTRQEADILKKALGIVSKD